jgi:uncharacterized membrane protein
MTQASPVNSATGNRLVFEDSIEVPAPIGEVYRRWIDFTRFPDFMRNVERVQPLGGNHYHWVARIFGIKQEWDAEVTEQRLNDRVSWRSTNGAYNAGTVSFSQLRPETTEVRLRLEYTPPGGPTGQALDKVTQATKREVGEDLRNFKKLYTPGFGAMDIMDTSEQGGSFGRLMGRMVVPAAAGIVGGIVGYTLENNNRRRYKTMQRPVEPLAASAGWVFTGASAASVITAAILRSRGDKHNSLFVGQWAPTLLTAGILSRAIGHRSIRTPMNTAGTSWGFAGATLGAIASSAILHARGRRSDGLFVGQWAPTFLATALLARLFDR